MNNIRDSSAETAMCLCYQMRRMLFTIPIHVIHVTHHTHEGAWDHGRYADVCAVNTLREAIS